MTQSLYELTDEFIHIQSLLDDGDGELTPEVEAALNALEDKTNAKIDGCCKMVQEYKRRAEAVDAEIVRLGEMRERNEKKVASLKAYVMDCLERAGYKRWSTDLFNVTVCKNSRPSIRYVGEVQNLPDWLKRVQVAFDGNAAYDAWKDNEELPEGVVVELGQHLRIR